MAKSPASAASSTPSGKNPYSKEDPLKNYEIVCKLGQGAYGSVQKARDKRDGQLVAIKILPLEGPDVTGLRREINILCNCKSEYIVGYKGTYEKPDEVWIVMEHCSASLADFLVSIKNFTFTEEQISAIMQMTLEGLKSLYGGKKIHRDIKSGNILVNMDGTCKIADFGVSAELRHTMSKRQSLIGTPYWMAPEVLKQDKYDFKADIWSLAITAMELAEGVPPHSNMHYLRAIIMIPKTEPPTLKDPTRWSQDFADFLKICLQKDPSQRPTTSGLLAHPFIAKSKGKSVVAPLIAECLPKIEAFREREQKKQAEHQQNQAPKQNADASAAAAGPVHEKTTKLDREDMVHTMLDKLDDPDKGGTRVAEANVQGGGNHAAANDAAVNNEPKQNK